MRKKLKRQQPPDKRSERSLLDQIVEQGRLARDPAARERGHNLVKEFVSQVLEGSMTVSKDAEAMINARIAQIDHLLSIQLNEILHHPAFQKLEGSWRGLKYLLDQSETSDKLKIKVLNVSKKELLRDLQRAPEFDQSALFKKVYEEEFGSLRRSSVRRADRRLRIRQGPAKISSCWRRSRRWPRRRMRRSFRRPSPDMFNLESFTNLDAPRDMAKIFDTTEYAKWKSFRQSEDSRYVGSDAAAHSDAAALWQGQQAGRSLQLRRERRRHGSLQIPVGQRGLRAGRAA